MPVNSTSQRLDAVAAKRFELGSELTIYSASDIYQQLLTALSQSSELVISLASVEEIDSAGVQVLLLIKSQSQQQSKKLVLSQHSASALEAMELLGVLPHFGDPVVLAAEGEPK